MTAAAFALTSAVCYGIADFTGGLLSRRAHFASVALSGQCGGLLLGLVASLLSGAVPRPVDLIWGGVSGAGTGLVTRHGGQHGGHPPASRDALLAGAGIALQYLALAQAALESGAWAVAAGRVVAIAVILPALAHRTDRPRMSGPVTVGAAATGAVAALALVFYLSAVHMGLMVIAVVLSSMYPVIPVVLGLTALRERVSTLQAAGLVGAAAAGGLLAAG
ncbi:MAG: multidrug DMT transporter permease [Stackebrandtia sp.]